MVFIRPDYAQPYGFATGQREGMRIGKIAVSISILAILKVLAITGAPVKAVSISDYSPGPRKQVIEKNNSNWTLAKSNKNFAFSEIEDPITKSFTLKLKDLKTGHIRDLIKSSAISALGKIRDVAPNGRTVIFETKIEEDGEYINQTFLLNTNGQKFFLLSDGISRKAEHTVDLEKISFVDQKVDLFYRRGDRLELEKKTVELVAKYSLVFNTHNDSEQVLKFYGGSLPYGALEQKVIKTNEGKQIDISFIPGISSIKKHSFTIENVKITKFREYKTNTETVTTRTEFLRNAHITENFIYNSKNDLIYSGASFGDPSIDLISLNKYLRKEVKEFYKGSLTDEVKIAILGKKFFIDLNDGSRMPVQSLLFALSYSNFGDYGFYSFTRHSEDYKEKEIFIFSNKNNSASFSKIANNLKEKIVLNEVDKFNYDYINISSELLESNYAATAEVK